MSLNDSENGIHRSENDHLVSLVQLLSKKNGKIFDESVAELLDWFDGKSEFVIIRVNEAAKKKSELIKESGVVVLLLELVKSKDFNLVCEFHAALQLLTAPLASDAFCDQTVVDFGIELFIVEDVFHSIMYHIQTIHRERQGHPVFRDCFRALYYIVYVASDEMRVSFFTNDSPFPVLVQSVLDIMTDLWHLKPYTLSSFLASLEYAGHALTLMFEVMSMEILNMMDTQVVFPQLVQLTMFAFTTMRQFKTNQSDHLFWVRGTDKVVSIMCKLCVDCSEFFIEQDIIKSTLDHAFCLQLLSFIMLKEEITDSDVLVNAFNLLHFTVTQAGGPDAIPTSNIVDGLLQILEKSFTSTFFCSNSIQLICRCLFLVSEWITSFPIVFTTFLDLDSMNVLCTALKIHTFTSSAVSVILASTVINILSDERCNVRMFNKWVALGIAPGLVNFLDEFCAQQELAEDDEVDFLISAEITGSLLKLLDTRKWKKTDSSLFQLVIIRAKNYLL